MPGIRKLQGMIFRFSGGGGGGCGCGGGSSSSSSCCCSSSSGGRLVPLPAAIPSSDETCMVDQTGVQCYSSGNSISISISSKWP